MGGAGVGVGAGVAAGSSGRFSQKRSFMIISAGRLGLNLQRPWASRVPGDDLRWLARRPTFAFVSSQDRHEASREGSMRSLLMLNVAAALAFSACTSLGMPASSTLVEER